MWWLVTLPTEKCSLTVLLTNTAASARRRKGRRGCAEWNKLQCEVCEWSVADAGVLPSSLKPCKDSYKAAWPQMPSRRSLGEISGRWDLWPIHLDVQRGAGDIPTLPSGRTSSLGLDVVRGTELQNRIRWDQRDEEYFWWTVFPRANSSSLLTYMLKLKSQFHSFFFLFFFYPPLADSAIWPCDVYQLIILCLFNVILCTPAAIWLSSGQTSALLCQRAVLKMNSGDVEHI